MRSSQQHTAGLERNGPENTLTTSDVSAFPPITGELHSQRLPCNTTQPRCPVMSANFGKCRPTWRFLVQTVRFSEENFILLWIDFQFFFNWMTFFSKNGLLKYIFKNKFLISLCFGDVPLSSWRFCNSRKG